MAVTDRSVTSRTIAQHVESVTHHSVFARIIRRRLQQSGLSARRLLLGLPLTQNHSRLRRQWCDERRMWVAERNEVVFTDESRICLQHHDGRIRVWRHRDWIASLGGSLSGPFADRKHVVHGCSTIDLDITPPAATPDQLWQCVEADWSAVSPRTHPKSL
ncbi:transposable element Tc1 transposase [Trichonephila clavipes]|uniref:Transposable element Tc1 transposase n=1 Tax=Trichonephila clavipes TaxID=2585209 RepID=A0A8X6W1Q3_TRICX|nr:transposable element Tc1 transposase [Trichonephila clavipes]